MDFTWRVSWVTEDFLKHDQFTKQPKWYRFYFIVGFAVAGVDNKSYNTACETGKMIR